MAKKLTPSRKQYLDTKTKYPDCIVFFRMGDFYEMFDEDAQTAAKELDIVLTSRANGKSGRIPMAGVPHHAAEGYIAKLISRGYKVALCEQVGSTPINGLMPREVVRVFTAGTVIEPGMLDAAKNNYLVAVVLDGERVGLAYADVTTGEFKTTVLNGRRALTTELARLTPAELLLPDSELALGDIAPTITHLPDWRFELGQAQQTLLTHFQVKSLAGFGCASKPLAIRAAGGILHYLQETQMGMVKQVQTLATYSTEKFMALDRNTRLNLELTESITGNSRDSLMGVLNKTQTAMGTRLLRQQITQPLLDAESLSERLDRVDAFFQNSLLRADVMAHLKGLPDLERLVNRILSQRATPRDVEQIGLVLTAVSPLKLLIADTPALADLLRNLDECPATANLIEQAINPDAPTNLSKMGVICAGFSPELDGVMRSSAHAREWVAQLEPRERERTGITSLKVGFNKVFGYYLEVTKANSQLVPDDYIRKQTLTNAERYITPDLKEYETLILNAEERILEIERRVFAEVCDMVAESAPRLLKTAHTLAQIDVAMGLAEVAALNNYVRPQLAYEVEMAIVNGRHPIVEQTLYKHGQIGERFTPNDTTFDEYRIHIITGPNMAGKSTYLRQVALITLMAQIGSFVPADSAHIGLVDRIFTRIGAHDELHMGRSTFMVEMVETAEILNHATHRSLLILDEIGRGTSTYDGLAIAWAVVEFLHNHPRLRPRTLFATHYHELIRTTDMLPKIANYSVSVAEEGDQIVFLHKVVAGGANRSYGIHVGQLAGLPRDVVNRAQEILHTLEAQAPTTSVEPSHLKTSQQMALFPEASPLLDELEQLDITTMTPLEAINKLYEWKKKYGEQN